MEVIEEEDEDFKEMEGTEMEDMRRREMEGMKMFQEELVAGMRRELAMAVDTILRGASGGSTYQGGSSV